MSTLRQLVDQVRFSLSTELVWCRARVRPCFWYQITFVQPMKDAFSFPETWWQTGSIQSKDHCCRANCLDISGKPQYSVTNGNLQLLFERHTTDTLRIHDVVPQWSKDGQCFIILLQCFLETSLFINTNNKGLLTGRATQYPSKPL